MQPHAIYLHGFASSPKSAKGVALGQRLAGQVSSYAIPDSRRRLPHPDHGAHLRARRGRAARAARRRRARAADRLEPRRLQRGLSRRRLARAARERPAADRAGLRLHRQLAGASGRGRHRRVAPQRRAPVLPPRERARPAAGRRLPRSCERLPAMPGEPRLPTVSCTASRTRASTTAAASSSPRRASASSCTWSRATTA